MGASGSSVGLVPRYLIAGVLWIAWVLLFLPKVMAPREKAVVRDASARWGMIVEGVAFGIMWSVPSFEVSPWRVAIGIIFGIVGLSTTGLAIRHLNKQWRFDAALNEDHTLVRTGPYAIVRHPIYAAMFAMLLAWGSLLAPWPAIIAGVVISVGGTEIRVRTEDRLLRSRFGEEFDNVCAPRFGLRAFH